MYEYVHQYSYVNIWSELTLFSFFHWHHLILCFYFRTARALRSVWSDRWTPSWSSPTTSANGWSPSAPRCRTSSCPRSWAVGGTTWATRSARLLSKNRNGCASCTRRSIRTTSTSRPNGGHRPRLRLSWVRGYYRVKGRVLHPLVLLLKWSSGLPLLHHCRVQLRHPRGQVTYPESQYLMGSAVS